MLKALPAPRFNTTLSSRQTSSCTIFARDSQRVLLQTNGNADDLIEFIVCPSQAQVEYVYVSTSSSPDVLPIDDDHVSINVIQSEAGACQNISVLLVFDNLVGMTTFTLTATDRESSVSECESSIRFTIAGFSFFEISPVSAETESEVAALQETRTLFSGDTNPVLSDYRDVLEERLRTLQVYVQYPDGTSSSSLPTSDLVSSLETIQVLSDSDATSPVQFNPNCSSFSHTSASELTVRCGAMFGIEDDGNSLTYYIRYVPYKDGTTKMSFLWPSFTEDVEALSEDLYENSLSISVLGDPPPIIESVEPKHSFWRSGGETISVTYDNVNTSIERRLQVGAFNFQEVPGSFRLLENSLYAAEYTSAPGFGADLDIRLEIILEDGTSVQSELVNEVSRFSYKTTPLSVNEVDPPFAFAGDTVTITGYFDGFDPSNLNHKLLIGTKPLSSLGIVPELSEDRQSLTFELPERDEIGTAYEFPISFAINSEKSTQVGFSFVSEAPLEISIRVLGASYDAGSDQYELGSCDPSEYIAELPDGISNPEDFAWHMVAINDPFEENLLEDNSDITNSSSNELRIPPTVFGGKTGTFIVSVDCEVNNEALTNSVIVVKSQAPVIGVSLISSSTRGIAFPDVAARVFAQIVTPPKNCYNRISPVVYEWVFQEKRYIKNNISLSGAQDITEPVVGLLGREFVIPQSFLTYGNQSVSLLAYIRDDSGINGTSVTTFQVRPVGLAPVITNGASFLVHDGNTNLQITSENTICPDCDVLGRKLISRYRWTCRISTQREGLDNANSCTMRFLPDPEAESFSISNQALLRQGDLNALDPRSEGSGRFFLRYTLQVGTDSFLSEETTQVIEVNTNENGVATLLGIDMLNNRGASLNMQTLPFYEDILIVPRAAGDVSWSLEMISPSLRSDVLADPQNLILFDHYYNPARYRSQRHPLGIKAYSLLPYERYTIRLNLSSSNPLVQPSEATIAVRTRDRPKLVLPDLLLDSGNTEDVFSAWAGVNLDASYPFRFYFFAVDNNGREQCLDGCSGSNTIQFRIPVAGKFRILVRLRDVHGSALMDEAYFPGTLSVTDSSSTLQLVSDLPATTQFASELERTGDHGTILLLTSMILTVQASWASESFTETERTSFGNMVSTLEEIVSNSVPSTSSSKSFIVAAVRLASLRSEYISPSTLESLLSIVNLAVRRVPREESFNHELELNAFYNLSIGHALRLFESAGGDGTTQDMDGDRDYERSVVLNVFRLLREQLTIVLSRDAHCGIVKQFSTILVQNDATAGIIGNGTGLAEVSRQVSGSYDILDTFQDPWKPRHAFFSMAVTCFTNQVNELRGEATSFKWCEESFAFEGGEQATDFRFSTKQLFSLLETMDYQFYTDAVSQESDTVFISNSSIALLSSKGVGDVVLPSFRSCFRLNLSVFTLGRTPYRGCLSADGYLINGSADQSSSQQTPVLIRNFNAVETYVPKDQSSTILLTTAATGTFGGVGVNCPANAKRPQVETPRFNIEFGYLAFGGAIVGVVGVTVSWVTSSSSYAALVGTAAAA
ncbi:PKD/REJ-like protein [Gracilaria domingensis]|nr:PKD/REJ-like protein [Gracilaria domingensis]